jgi:hypothetical protein
MIKALFAILYIGSSALAQVGEPTIAGHARDASGQVLPGVVVTAEPVSGPSAFAATTDAGGQYRMTVPAGRYRVSFQLAGYATHVAPEVVVDPGETSELEVVLYIALSTNVVVTGRSTFRNLASIDSSWDLIGIADAASTGVIPASELEERSLLRPADVLERVPGLVVSQHSGEGKGNQYYVRGFNIDHGTDLALSVAGVPANLPTHAHGQGYADVNFLVPELVSGIQFNKGPYHAQEGDFSAAGAVHTAYSSRLDEPLVKVEAGQYGYQRGLVAASPAVGDGHLLAALELVHKDGPWVHPDDYEKVNGVLRWSQGEALSGLSVTGMFYDADWSSTDQIPERAVADGRLTRFDAVDPTDGGKARRASLSAEWQAYDGQNATRLSGFLLRNELNLWSNFTYVLDDPENGDQFEQEDRRWVFGFDGSHKWMGELGGRTSELELGGGVRHDAIGDVGLYATASRARLSTTRRDEVGETSLFLYGQNVYQWTPHVRSTLGLRGDFYVFDVASNLAENSGHRTAGLVSPKAGLVFGPFRRSEVYLNAGLGFHSNDARGTTTHVDPKTGEPADPVDPLVRGWGAEVGVRTLAFDKVHTTFAFWGLGLDSELLYVGDAGTTEAGRPSERLGFEWSLDALPRPWLALDVSWAYSRARFTDEDPAGDRIPSAIEGVATAGMAVTGLNGWIGNLRWRYFGPRALIEDDSVRSEAAHLFTAQIGYAIGEHVTVKLDVFNLFDAEVSDIDYFYASRLPGEAEEIEDIHFHPMEPFTARLGVAVRF